MGHVRDAQKSFGLAVYFNHLLDGRMFNEALGVTKEGPLSIGPRSRNEIRADRMTIADLS
jgi:hypothetical protein